MDGSGEFEGRVTAPQYDDAVKSQLNIGYGDPMRVFVKRSGISGG